MPHFLWIISNVRYCSILFFIHDVYVDWNATKVDYGILFGDMHTVGNRDSIPEQTSYPERCLSFPAITKKMSDAHDSRTDVASISSYWK